MFAQDRKLQDLRSDSSFSLAQLKRIGETAELLKKQLAEVNELTAKATTSLPSARSEVRNEPTAMTLLLLTNELQNNRARAAKLEERLYIDLPKQRDELNRTIAQNKNEQGEQLTKIEVQKSLLAGLRPTRQLVSPMRQNAPVGLGVGVIIGLAVFLGIVLGVAAGLIAEYLKRLRAGARAAFS